MIFGRHKKPILRILALRILVSATIFWFYIDSAAQRNTTKWWTFVEGITEPTTFLPLIDNSRRSKFNQNLLFSSCLNISSGADGGFISDLCDIRSDDNQNFTVTLRSGRNRSDGTPISIGDLIFSFEDIIIQNQRSLPNFDSYTETTVELVDSSTLQINFPSSSPDNRLFFLTPILPSHILKNKSRVYFQTEFASNPVHSQCGSIVPRSSDPDSLITDLSRCDDTAIAFYQIKSYDSPDEIIQNQKQNFVDAILLPRELSGFTQIPVISHDLSALFFNTNSPLLRVRTRRALAGLIVSALDQRDTPFVSNQRYFDNFLSDGQNAAEFLTRLRLDNVFSPGELEESGITAVTGATLRLDNTTHNQAFYREAKPNSLNIQRKNAENSEITPIIVRDSAEGETEEITMRKWSDDTFFATLSTRTRDEQLIQFSIGSEKNDKFIAENAITIYNLDGTQSDTGTVTLRILLLDTPYFQAVADTLRQIFLTADVQENFEFIIAENAIEFETQLARENYDIALLNIGKWLKTDISAIFSTTNPIINPSQYRNTKFQNLLDTFIRTQTTRARSDLNAHYAQTMPFLILGNPILHLNIEPKRATQLQSIESSARLESTRRTHILQNLEMVRRPDFTAGLTRTGFQNFLARETIDLQKLSLPSVSLPTEISPDISPENSLEISE